MSDDMSNRVPGGFEPVTAAEAILHDRLVQSEAEVERLREERDTALALLQDTADQLTKSKAEVERLTKERDSARKLYLSAGEARDRAEAEVERLREDFKQIDTERANWKRWCLDREAEVERLRKALEDAMNLLENSRCDLGDPSLRRRWGQMRRELRGVARDSGTATFRQAQRQ